VAYNAKSNASYCLADPPYWVRFFKPLLAAGFPQTATNAGLEGLGFVREGFRQLADVSHLDLRIGMSFAHERS
jgi:hypothetical protein